MPNSFPTKRLVRVNGCGEAIDGYVAPDSELVNLHCEHCHDVTPFIKMVGVVKKYLLWIPIKTIGEEFTYWQCNYCNRFIYHNIPRDLADKVNNQYAKNEK